MASRRRFSMCLWTYEKKTFFSCQRLTRSGGVGQGRAILRAAQRTKRLDGRWSGGYFATGAEGRTPVMAIDFATLMPRKRREDGPRRRPSDVPCQPSLLCTVATISHK
jgi:hypothetical protein